MQKKEIVSSYAKAKVEQIRRKFGYSSSDKENVVKAKPEEQLGIEKRNQISRDSAKKLQLQQRPCQYLQYNSRIKSIDEINEKINKFLKTSKDMVGFENKEKIVKSQLCQYPFKSEQNLPTTNKKENHPSTPPKTKQTKPQTNKKYQLSIPNAISIQLTDKECVESHLVKQKDIDSPVLKGLILNMPKKREEIKSPTKKQFTHKRMTNKGTNQYVEKKQIMKLAKNLSEQIQKDQKLNYQKWLFSQWNEPKKWQILTERYNKLFVCKKNEEQIKKIFLLSSEEHNPFFEANKTVTEREIEELLKSYKDAQDCWNKSVKQCVSINILEKQNFNVKDLDLNKKGYISIEDIVCFVNLHAGNFFRNRDVIRIFKRFMQKQLSGVAGIRYQNFLQKVTC